MATLKELKETAIKAGAEKVSIRNNVMRYETGANDPHYLSHPISIKNVPLTDIWAMVKCCLPVKKNG